MVTEPFKRYEHRLDRVFWKICGSATTWNLVIVNGDGTPDLVVFNDCVE